MSQEFPDLESYQIDDSWAVAHSSIRNLPVIVRLRPNLIDIAGHPQLSHRIRVIWKYQPDSEFGLPATEEMTSMDVCENALIESGVSQTVLEATAQEDSQWEEYLETRNSLNLDGTPPS